MTVIFNHKLVTQNTVIILKILKISFFFLVKMHDFDGFFSFLLIFTIVYVLLKVHLS